MMIQKITGALILWGYIGLTAFAQAQATPDTTVSFLFMGDIMGHDSQIRSAWSPEMDQYDYSSVFTYLQPEFESVDFAIANLEVTLAGPPYKGYPQFSSPDALAVAARDHGIDVLVTANNHSADRRNAGIRRTIRVLDSLDIAHTGTFTSPEHRRETNLLVLEKQGIRVGLLNYTFSTNGIPVPGPEMVNRIDREQIQRDVEAAKAEPLDKLLVFVHWGQEYQHQPHSSQTSLTEYLFDLGVDWVIGAHPHVLQYMAWDSQQDKVVVYSMGNFVSNQRDRGRDGGSMFRLQLEKKNGEVRISEAGYKLIWVYKRYLPGRVLFHVIPCSPFEAWPDFFETEGSWEAFQTFVKDSRALYSRDNVRVPEYRWVGGRWRLDAPPVSALAPLPSHWDTLPPLVWRSIVPLSPSNESR